MNTKFESKTGESFQPDQFPIIFREGQIVFDFKKSSPRLDKIGDTKTQTVVSEHNAITMTPEKAKSFKKLLEKNIEKYEEKYGEIEIEQKEQETEDQQVEESQDYIA